MHSAHCHNSVFSAYGRNFTSDYLHTQRRFGRCLYPISTEKYGERVLILAKSLQ